MEAGLVEKVPAMQEVQAVDETAPGLADALPAAQEVQEDIEVEEVAEL